MNLFKIVDKRYPMSALGLIPDFLWELDDRPAKEQFQDRYAHGGGWFPMKGWKHDEETHKITWEDETYSPIAKAQLRDEKIFVYPHAWVMILQADGSFEVSRMD